jgi:hypothetical protein
VSWLVSVTLVGWFGGGFVGGWTDCLFGWLGGWVVGLAGCSVGCWLFGLVVVVVV